MLGGAAVGSVALASRRGTVVAALVVAQQIGIFIEQLSGQMVGLLWL